MLCFFNVNFIYFNRPPWFFVFFLDFLNLEITLFLEVQLLFIFFFLFFLCWIHWTLICLWIQICNSWDRPNQSFIVENLLVLFSFFLKQWKYFLVVPLLKFQQLIKIFHLIANAQLVIAFLNMCKHYVHEFAEHILRGIIFAHWVSHKNHY